MCFHGHCIMYDSRSGEVDSHWLCVRTKNLKFPSVLFPSSKSFSTFYIIDKVIDANLVLQKQHFRAHDHAVRCNLSQQ